MLLMFQEHYIIELPTPHIQVPLQLIWNIKIVSGVLIGFCSQIFVKAQLRYKEGQN